jgi:hypothetical protein
VPVETPSEGSHSSTRVEVDDIRLLLGGSVENLLATWNDDLALFPFSSTLHGTTILNSYSEPTAVRYTINSLLGLLEAARSGSHWISEADAEGLTEAFLARAEGRINLPADHGLLTILQGALGAGRSTLRAQVEILASVLATRGTKLIMQDAAWILWGASDARRRGLPEAADVARTAYRLITRHLVDDVTGLPRHSRRRYRRDIVSFGALVYFLRSMHEAAAALGEEEPNELFESGVARAIGLQGPRGEWPWMINARSGAAFDFYPVFAVHQDSMAMLFLHPALDRGVTPARDAIGQSLAWVFGENELGLKMFVEEPYFAYRSIERAERASRARRYCRSLARRVAAAPAAPDAHTVRINEECRSYHLGWILYVWSNRPEGRAATSATQRRPAA